jgi:opacity protein-like surface antigen
MRFFALSATILSFAANAAAAPLDAGRWSASAFGGLETTIEGDVHGGARAPVADLGGLNPALRGVAAELRIQERSFDEIYGEATTYGLEAARGIGAGREIFASLRRTETDDGSVQVGTAFVPALAAELPVFGNFSAYESTGLEAGVRQYFAAGAAVQPYIAGRVGAAQVEAINATFTIPAASIRIANAPFYADTTTFSLGLDVGVSVSVTDRFALSAETGLRYQSALDGDDAAIGGLGLAAINEEGERFAAPLLIKGALRF